MAALSTVPLASVEVLHNFTTPRRYVAACRCGARAGFTATNSNIRVAGRMVNALVSDGAALPLSNGLAACSCGREVRVTRVVATVTEHTCGAKCRNSKGPNCDCSCGGKNHGAGFPLSLV